MYGFQILHMRISEGLKNTENRQAQSQFSQKAAIMLSIPATSLASGIPHWLSLPRQYLEKII